MVERQKREVQYKLIRQEGGTRVLAVGKYLPPNWRMVKITVGRKIDDDTVVLKISRVA